MLSTRRIIAPLPVCGDMHVARLRQIRLAHQIAVAFTGGPAALIEGPNDQALAAAAVPGRENTGNTGRVSAVERLDVGALVACNAQLLEQLVFGSSAATP